MLSDRDIAARLRHGTLRVEPIGDLDLQLQPASIDLRFADTVRQLLPAAGNMVLDSYGAPSMPVDLREPEDYASAPIPLREGLLVRPGDFFLGSTIERVTMPDDLVGRVEGRSSIGRQGLIVHATAGFIDPGFQGNITLEITNLGPRPVFVPLEHRICQLSFLKLDSPSERPYGHPTRRSKYQGDVGPQGAKGEQASTACSQGMCEQDRKHDPDCEVWAGAREM